MSTPVVEVQTKALEVRARVNESGRVVLPKELRESLGIEPGDVVFFSIDGETVKMETQKHRIRMAQQMVREYIDQNRSLVDELIAERREEFRKEMSE